MSNCTSEEQDQFSLRYPPLAKESMVKQEQAPAIPHVEIPNGGFSAYLQVFGAFLLFINS